MPGAQETVQLAKDVKAEVHAGTTGPAADAGDPKQAIFQPLARNKICQSRETTRNMSPTICNLL